MLETLKLPASSRFRSIEATRINSANRLVNHSALSAAPRREALVIPRPKSVAHPNRLGRSEMRLMGLATACTVGVCGILLLYLAAYAQVTRLGIAQADARAQLRRNLLQNEMLRAERDRLQSPQYVILKAESLGMSSRGSTPVEYLSSATMSAKNGSIVPGASPSDGADQVITGGTTADNSSAASLDH